MSAEGMPQGDGGWFARLAARATRWIVRRPVAVLTAAAMLTVLSLVYAAGRLEFRTSRLDLLNPESDFNKLWLAYLDEFGDRDDAVVAIEGDSPQAIAPQRQALAERLARESDFFDDVLHKADLSGLRAKGLHFLPLEQLQQIDGLVAQAEPIVQGDWTPLNFTKRLRRLNEALRTAQSSPGRGTPPSRAGADVVTQEVEQLASHLTAALQNSSPSAPLMAPLDNLERSLAAFDQPESDYLRTRDGWMGFVLLRLVPQNGDNHPAIARLRTILAEEQTRHAGVRLGLTGMPVLEDDEMRASRQDMSWANVLSFIGVALLFVVGFGSWRHPVLCNVALLAGMAWSLGYITLAVGRLNLLSVAFGVILIGLGIDYGIHFAARYLHLRRASQTQEGADGEREEAAVENALTEAARSVAPAIIIGAVTTALAFFTAGLTQFTGVAELGVIAGGGILLCCVAELAVLPALIAVVEQRWPPTRFPQAIDMSLLIRPAMRWPWAAVVLSAGVTLLLLLGLPKLRYDHNLLHLQADHLESVVLEKKLFQETDKSVWFAVSMADTPEELQRRKALFAKLPAVDRTEDIASLLVASDEAQSAAIARIAARLQALPEQPPWLDVDPPEKLAAELAQLHAACAAFGPDGATLAARLKGLQAMLGGLTPRQYYERLSPYQQRLAGETLGRLRMLRSLADPAPPQLADLPPSLTARFVGKTNRHLLRVYGRGDIWEIENLEQFVQQVKSVDPRATGHPLQTYYASKQMQQSYVHAAIYALLAVGIVLMLDFRSMRHTLLALAPVALAMVQMFGIMGLCNLPLNPANMIALPLMLGIGVDNGVHIVHDFRSQTGRYRLSPSTVVAVMLASLTTIVGFASLLVAGHQGIRSLGLTLTIGMTCCLVSSLATLPPLLALLRPDPTLTIFEGAESPPAIVEANIIADEPTPHVLPVPVALRRRAA